MPPMMSECDVAKTKTNYIWDVCPERPVRSPDYGTSTHTIMHYCAAKLCVVIRKEFVSTEKKIMHKMLEMVYIQIKYRC